MRPREVLRVTKLRLPPLSGGSDMTGTSIKDITYAARKAVTNKWKERWCPSEKSTSALDRSCWITIHREGNKAPVMCVENGTAYKDYEL